MRHQNDKKVKQCCQPKYDTINPDNITAIPGISTKDKDVYEVIFLASFSYHILLIVEYMATNPDPEPMPVIALEYFSNSKLSSK